MRPEDCVILIPVASHLEPECEAAVQELLRRGHPARTLRGCSQVDLARSALATQAVDDGFAETLWVDADVAFRPDDVDRLRAHNLPFTCGLYPKKGPREFAGKFRAAGSTRFGDGGGLLEVQYAGMGFTHVRREVYEAVRQRFDLPRCGGGYDPAKAVVPYFIPTLVPDGAGGWCYLSEDYSFCHRARAAGFPPVADTRVKLGHVGRKTYTWDDFAGRDEYAAMDFDIQLTTPGG